MYDTQPSSVDGGGHVQGRAEQGTRRGWTSCHTTTMSERPSSIDLTLELERQLENELNSPSRPQSLDHHVLAHIITDLRSSVAETTRHRDELAKSVAEIQTREKDLIDTLAHMTDKCSKLQEELDVAKSKAQDSENSISLLRTKVEESRYVTPCLCSDQLSTSRPGGDSCASSPRADDKAKRYREWISPELTSRP